MSRTQIELDKGNITLIGTAHISRESIEEVSRCIREEKPDIVCVEIDSGRYDSITGANWQKLDMIKTIREGKGFLLIANLVLSSFQRRLGSEAGVEPGEEMKAAIQIAKELGIPFAFCDREVQLTLRRAWAKCGFFSRAKLLSVLISSAFNTTKISEEEIENLKKNSELDSMMNEISDFLPEVKETLIDERDYYLAAKIWEESAGKNKTVAVLGAGHLNGVRAHIEKFASEQIEKKIDLSAIEVTPRPGLWSKIAAWIIPALIIVFVAIGIWRADFSQVSEGLLRWLIWNGSLAALGALIALAHPLAILISFIGAPIGTLSPVISVGLFSGIAQAWLRRPRIEDAQTLTDDAMSIKGIYRNRITHILLVFFLASLGGAIGNIISFASFAKIISNFF
ncbi:MAG: TraB/GumN family protein [Spirochaetaceae bacterium]|jgi:pheromone shutdown-related protein TraB|nr:TraB/GumN family protein [Spirochaetaceae bacterium]